MDLELISRLRSELRAVLPELRQGAVSNNTLSACLGLMTEATTIRLIQEIQRLRGTRIGMDEPKALSEEVAKALSDALSAIVLKHVPDAGILHGFKAP